jgi:hypothetical protein
MGLIACVATWSTAESAHPMALCIPTHQSELTSLCPYSRLLAKGEVPSVTEGVRVSESSPQPAC